MTAMTQSTEHNLSIEPCLVLLIEDDLDDRIFAKKELKESANVRDVVTFGDGAELTQYMVDNGYTDKSVMLSQPILILVDLEMPKKDGLQVIEELKHDVFLQDIPLIVVSGTQDPEKLRRAKELGANGVFEKPLRAEMLDKFYVSAWKWPPNSMW